MSRILFSKNTNSTGSSKDPSSKPKLPKIESPIEEQIPVRVSNKRPKQPTLQLDAHYPKVTYPCHLCPKIYTSIHALRGHQNAHKRDGLIPRVQEVDLKEHEGENDVKVNPERRCDHPQYRRRYSALRQRASNHNIKNQPRPRPCPLCTRPTHQIPIHPNHNRGDQPSYGALYKRLQQFTTNEPSLGPNRRVSNFPPPPPPSPTYNVTLVPTQVTVNEWVPTTRRLPPPPPPPLSSFEPMLNPQQIATIGEESQLPSPTPTSPQTAWNRVSVHYPLRYPNLQTAHAVVPVVEGKFEFEEVPAQPSFPPNFGNLQIDGAADANVADDASPNDDLDLDLKL